MMGNYHARCGAGEKPEVETPEAYLSLFALPDDFCSLLSTMRSREISSIIIIQNFAQLKALFKDTWETIPGNCDTFIYLGGNEQSTHKYVSELLGKGTIDKKSSGETKGRQGNILQGKEKIFVSMPSYKTKQVDEHGKPIYQDVCYPVTKDFREKLYNEIIAEYEKAKDKSNEKARENAEQNHGNPDRDKKDTPFR